MKKKILVTGGLGFIGSHTADALAKKGFAIRILDSLEPPVHVGKWPKYMLGKGHELIKQQRGMCTRSDNPLNII